jgi:glycosyltransferase involved in cell wall biosynthesis
MIQVKPTSILLICHTYPPVIGGSEIEAQRVCEALIARGHHIQVVCAGGGPMPPVRDWVDPKGVPVRIYAESWNGALKDIIFALRVAGMLIRERNNYEIVYFLMQGLHLAAGLPVAKALGKRIVVKIAGSGVVPLMNQSVSGRLELRFLRQWARYVMVLNEGMRQEAVDHGLLPTQLVWMPNPIDADEFAPCPKFDRAALRARFAIPATAPVVLYCGRLAPEKGLSLLLKAFAIVVQQKPQAKLVLVGDGICRRDLEKQAGDLSLTSSVCFAGRVDPAEVPSWLKAADLFALTSPAEGFSCAVAEAMSTGLPCVVSDIPANRQLVTDGEHGFLTPVGNSNAIAAAILRLASDRPLLARMGQAARQSIVDNYSTSRVADRYEALFQSALSRKNPVGNGTPDFELGWDCDSLPGDVEAASNKIRRTGTQA